MINNVSHGHNEVTLYAIYSLTKICTLRYIHDLSTSHRHMSTASVVTIVLTIIISSFIYLCLFNLIVLYISLILDRVRIVWPVM